MIALCWGWIEWFQLFHVYEWLRISQRTYHFLLNRRSWWSHNITPPVSFRHRKRKKEDSTLTIKELENSFMSIAFSNGLTCFLRRHQRASVCNWTTWSPIYPTHKKKSSALVSWSPFSPLKVANIKSYFTYLCCNGKQTQAGKVKLAYSPGKPKRVKSFTS